MARWPAFDPFAEHEAVLAGELARVVARPEDELRKHRKFKNANMAASRFLAPACS